MAGHFQRSKGPTVLLLCAGGRWGKLKQPHKLYGIVKTCASWWAPIPKKSKQIILMIDDWQHGLRQNSDDRQHLECKYECEHKFYKMNMYTFCSDRICIWRWIAELQHVCTSYDWDFNLIDRKKIQKNIRWMIGLAIHIQGFPKFASP